MFWQFSFYVCVRSTYAKIRVCDCEFCFYYQTGLCLPGFKSWLCSIPKPSDFHGKAGAAARVLTQQGGAESHLALCVFPEENHRTPLGIFPKGDQGWDWAPGGTGVAPPGPGDQDQPGGDQGGELSIPVELLRGFTPKINQFMDDLRMSSKPGWTREEVPGGGAFTLPII